MTTTELQAAGITQTGTRFFANGKRISQAKAAELVATACPEQITQPTQMKFEKLNAATRDLFFELCEAIMSATGDHDLLIGVRIGRDIPKISLHNAPRLSNLKKAGLLERVGAKGGYLVLTDLGRSIYHGGNV